MKKIACIIALMALTLLTHAQQSKTYKQRLNSRINIIEASGDVMIRVVEDTVPYIAIQFKNTPVSIDDATFAEVTQALVKVDSNHLTTTATAHGKFITLGTTLEDSLVFIIKEGAEVLFNGTDYTHEGRYVVKKECSSEPERDWTGLTQYDLGARLQWDFMFGWNSLGNGILGSANSGNELFKLSSFGSSVRWSIGYSLYMDRHIAMGVGVDLMNSDNYYFDMHYVENGSNGALAAPTIANAERWTTSIENWCVGMPIHFIFFPSAKNHLFNFGLELVPKFCYITTFKNNYKYEDDTQPVTEREIRTLSHSTVGLNRFDLDLRLSVEIGFLGLFVETGLLSAGNFGLDTALQAKYGTSDINAFHLSFGMKIDIFNLAN